MGYRGVDHFGLGPCSYACQEYFVTLSCLWQMVKWKQMGMNQINLLMEAVVTLIQAGGLYTGCGRGVGERGAGGFEKRLASGRGGGFGGGCGGGGMEL